MEKNSIKKLLISMRTPDNEEKIIHLLKSLDQISDEELHLKFEKMNLSDDNIKKYLENLIKKSEDQEEKSENFINVNDWFCYGRTGDTVHMHLIPKDLRDIKKELGDEAFYCMFKEQLEDFLSKMQFIILEDDSIKTLFAVSPIFYNSNITLIHESLGFDRVVEIDLNNENDNMNIEQKEYFLNMFNKGDNSRRVYYTRMTREKLLEREYQQIKEEDSHLKR